MNHFEDRYPWTAFAVRRIIRLIVSLFVVVSVVFFMISLVPGDAVRSALGPTAPIDVVNARRAKLGLDKPIWERYVNYLHDVFTGNFGSSITSERTVGEIISTRLANTAELIVAALILTLVLAIVIGMVVGILTHNGRRSRTMLSFTVTSSAINTIPGFVFGIVLVYVFSVQLQWLPVAGSDGFKSLILPTIALSLGPAAGLSRIVRAQTDVTLGEDYMRVARGKRLSWARLYLRHALPNLLTAALTIGGLLLGILVAGSVLIESVYARAGLGTQIVQSITDSDYPVVQGVLMVLASSVLIINLIVDLALGLLDRQSVIARA